MAADLQSSNPSPGGYQPPPPTFRSACNDLQHLVGKAKKLKSRLSELPSPDAEGHFKCPDAEYLYFLKEQAECSLSCSVDGFDETVEFVREQLELAEKTLAQLQRTQSNLQTPRAIEEYKRALWDQEQEYLRWKQLDKALEQALEMVQDLLARSQKKKFPGRIPRGHYGELPFSLEHAREVDPADPTLWLPPPPPPPEDPVDRLQRELEDLIERGTLTYLK